MSGVRGSGPARPRLLNSLVMPDYALMPVTDVIRDDARSTDRTLDVAMEFRCTKPKFPTPIQLR